LLGFVTPGLTAGVISGERERQTLNVLLTTRLTTWQIIWSKLVSSSAFVVLLVVATLPLYSIVFLYGGIAPGQVLGVFGFYLVTMFLFGSIGVACSSFFKRTGVSTVTAYGLAFALSAGTGFLAVFLHELDRFQHQRAWTPATQTPGFIEGVVQFLQDINPVFVLMQILGENGIETGINFGLPYWGVYTLFYLTGGVLLLYWSARLLAPRKKG
ncbi:MAG: ABC transporter permease, partial [Firmicutes bacterium]|nr:ABC transporter permease [Bacillota bacterium]